MPEWFGPAFFGMLAGVVIGHFSGWHEAEWFFRVGRFASESPQDRANTAGQCGALPKED